MSTAESLKAAIAKKLQVTATYDGYYREFCPHAIGWKRPTKKNPVDTHKVIVYQFGGETSEGPVPAGGAWKCFDVSGLSGVALREGEWHTGANHTQPNTCMDQDRIELEVSY